MIKLVSHSLIHKHILLYAYGVTYHLLMNPRRLYSAAMHKFGLNPGENCVDNQELSHHVCIKYHQ